jgi:5'-deoxynucleotidase YfbR-like HD superfamily hydrolase
MTIPEIQDRLYADDAYVLAELDKIALYYQLKHTIRWAHVRSGVDETESVAEHIYGMHILIDWFLPLIDTEHTLNRASITSMATWHDIAEAVVTDMTTRTKTEAHKQAEQAAETALIANAAPHLSTSLNHLFREFNAQETEEARFVKAIDKIEPLFQLYFLSKKEPDLRPKFDLGWTAEVYRAHRAPYIDPFPLIKRIDTVLMEATRDFHPES